MGVAGTMSGISAIFSTHIYWWDGVVDLMNLSMKGQFDEKGRF
jgi:hypothetical protein